MTSRISAHSLETLEFPKILSLLEGKCITPFGCREIAAVKPLFDRETINRIQNEHAQMTDIIKFGLPFPLVRLPDCTEHLEHSTVEGTALEPSQIRQLLELIELSLYLHRYDREGREKFPAIATYLQRMRAFPELKSEINRCIDERGEIKDSASPQLKRIRRELFDLRKRLVSKLEKILAGRTKQSGWQDDIITQRNERYVIAVLASQYQTSMGILHDRSNSGNTLYVEPSETVETNNRLNLLQQEERNEIHRILCQLTAEIAQRADALKENCLLLGLLDARHAGALLAIQLGSVQPNINNDSNFDLKEARHPLLLITAANQKDVIPLSLSLDNDRLGILITGPNTGGKTVALKTVGLLILMAQSGLPIPAHKNSTIGIFTQVFADIGDEQSIEQSLSTFSSHIRHIIDAAKHADSHTLILLDEIGAGTDPKEGAALAEAILIHLVQCNSRLIVTTHYSQLKTLPLSHPQLENASLEFDRTTLAPTFRLHLGIPGSSYAVEIASRLGMEATICEHAAKLIGTGERSLAELIANLESELAQLRKDRIELNERLDAARELEQQYQEKTSNLKSELDEQRKKALTETEQILKETRRETERLVAEIRRTQAKKETVQQLHRKIEDSSRFIANELARLEQRPENDTAILSFVTGAAVRILSLDQAGEIEELLSDDRARVRVGSMMTVVRFRDLQLLSGMTPKKLPPISRVQASDSSSVSSEIHLRGMTVEEALESLERYLDRAVLAGLPQVYIIHGKGTGTLRRVLTTFLRKHPEVDSVQLGNWNEGGAGVTVVKLKE